MIIGTILQQPNEVLDYDIQYADFFSEFPADSDGTKDTIAGQSGLDVKVEPANELNAVVFYVNEERSKVVLRNGVAGMNYTVTVTMTSEGGRVKEDELIVVIEEF
tara:strand:- start:139 stop:453 length:315 start_codon:yes stop_codon:yes gene_type:complete